VGGTFLPVGHDLAAWWESEIPGIVVLVDTTAGSVENLTRLVSGQADLAIVGDSPFREVLEGWGNAAGAERTCVVGTLYTDAEQYVVRASLVRAGNLLDLNGLLMYPGPHNSGGEIDTRRILAALDIEPRFVYVDERDKGYAAAAAALEAGNFDAVTFSGGVPIQAVSDLFRRHPGEYVILPFTRHMLRRLQHYHADFQGTVIRADSYPGQTKEVATVGGANFLVAAPGLDPRLIDVLDRSVRTGVAAPGTGLRGPSSHPVLQALTPAHWDETSDIRRCVSALSVLGPVSADPEGRR
jgi:TRAP transporter TAXI family solute receptor